MLILQGTRSFAPLRVKGEAHSRTRNACTDGPVTNGRVLFSLFVVLNADFVRDAGMAKAKVLAFSTTNDLPLD